MLNNAPSRHTPRRSGGPSARAATGQGNLFATEAPAEPRQAPGGAPREDAPILGMRPAAAHLVNSTVPDMHDPEGRPLAFLVVQCPFCEHQHVHPGGHVGAPRLCPRRSRCIARPAGAYYFPAVQP